MGLWVATDFECWVAEENMGFYYFCVIAVRIDGEVVDVIGADLAVGFSEDVYVFFVINAEELGFKPSICALDAVGDTVCVVISDVDTAVS